MNPLLLYKDESVRWKKSCTDYSSWLDGVNITHCYNYYNKYIIIIFIFIFIYFYFYYYFFKYYIYCNYI